MSKWSCRSCGTRAWGAQPEQCPDCGGKFDRDEGVYNH